MPALDTPESATPSVATALRLEASLSAWQRAATAGYSLLRRGLRRLRLSSLVDVRIHQIIAVAPWRLALPERQPRGMSVRWLTPADGAAIAGLRRASGHSYGERFAQGEQALGAFLDQRLVAFLWTKRGPAEMASSFG